MKQGYTHITFLVDRSGSMQAIQHEAENGLNMFLKQQKEGPGECTVSLYQFDNIMDTVHDFVNIHAIEKNFVLEPRSSTALLDSMYDAIAKTGDRLSALAEDQRPSLVIFAVMTDGQENCSKKISKSALSEKIKEQQDKYNWQFTYLSSDLSAIQDGHDMKAGDVTAFSNDKVYEAYEATSLKCSRMRAQSVSGFAVQNSYTDEERGMMQ